MNSRDNSLANEQGLQGLSLIFCNVAEPERRFKRERDEVVVAQPSPSRNVKGEALWSIDEHSLCPKDQFISEIDVRFQEWSFL